MVVCVVVVVDVLVMVDAVVLERLRVVGAAAGDRGCTGRCRA